MFACTAAGEPDEPLEASAVIPAAVGGSIELEDGSRVDFEPGVLAADTEITFRRLGCGGIQRSDSFSACRYAVEGPDEVLHGGFTLTMAKRTGVEARCAAQETRDSLACLLGSVDEAETIAARVSGFSEYTSWSSSVVMPPGACALPDFVPCGGDVTGNWVMVHACGTIEQLTSVSWSGPDPYAACDPLDSYVGYPFSVSGKIDVLPDGTYGSFGSFDIKKHSLVTDSCLDLIDEACHPDCTDVDGICECLFPKTQGEGGVGQDMWAYGAADGELVLGSTTVGYCVDGDQLTVQWGSEGDRYYTVYERA